MAKKVFLLNLRGNIKNRLVDIAGKERVGQIETVTLKHTLPYVK